MRIRGWHIEGFGLFRDQGVRDLPDGLTVICGPNEAGKSTLLAFVRRTLFGYPHGNIKIQRHPPLNGGRHGGRLLVDSEGEYVVERFAPKRFKLRLPGGDEGGETHLKEILGGSQETVFDNVFAFSLRELESTDTLNKAEVRDLLFSAGVAGAGRSARAAMEQLRKVSLDLWVSGGSARRIHLLQKDLKELEGRIGEAQEAAARYVDAVEVERALNLRVEELGGHARAAEHRRDRAMKLLDAWPVQVKRNEAQERLADLDAVDSISTGTRDRVVRLGEKVEALERRLGELARKGDELDREAAGIDPDERLLAIGAEVRDVYGDSPLQRKRLEDLPELREGRDRSDRDVTHRLAELGPGWGEERLKSFDQSISAREEVRKWIRRLDELERAVQEAEWSREEASERIARQRNAVDAARGELRRMEEPPGSEELSARDSALSSLRMDTAVRDRRKLESDSLRDEIEDREQRLGELRIGAWLPPKHAVIGVAGLGLLVLMGAAWRALTEDVAGALLLGIVGLTLFFLAPVVGSLITHLRRQAASRDAESRHQERKQADSEARLDQCLVETGRVQTRIEATCARLGLETGQAAEIEEAARRLDEARRSRQRFESAATALSATEGELAELEREMEVKEDNLSTAREQVHRHHADWDVWCRERGVSSSLSPSAADLFSAVGQARATLERRDRAANALERVEAQSEAFFQRVRPLADRVGVRMSGGYREVLTTLELLHRQLENAEEAHRHLDRLRRDASGLQRESAGERRNLEQASKELRELFDVAGAHDRASFEDRYRTSQRRAELRRSVTEAEADLATRLGGGEEAAGMRRELAGGTVGRWESDAALARDEAERITAERDQALGDAREAGNHREALEASSSIVELENRREALVAERDALARRWSVHVLARSLIEETLRTFERNRQPAVLQRAQVLFANVTGAHYAQLIQRDQELIVVTGDGQELPAASLSRGAVEQLYLCLRFALAEDLAERTVPLPFVMDDVLVNFDPERARAVARLITEVAERHQVLFFTCHPHTAELLRSASPRARLYDMSRYGGDLVARTG